jgi:general secretion pathway protein I
MRNEAGFLPCGRSDEHGFTLLEILVALAVFSLAALALIRLETASVRGAAVLDRTLLANMVARNIAIEAVTDAAPPARGASSGMEANGGESWRWTRVVTPTADPRISRVDVTVQGAAGQVLGRTTMVRPAPEAPDVQRPLAP